MSPKEKPTEPRFVSIAAHLYTCDLGRSLDFFTRKLGFVVDFVYGEPAFYAQVSRDNARLALRSIDQPVMAEELRKMEDLLSASIVLATSDEIQQLLVAYQASGVTFHQDLKDEPWGAKTFIVEDPDGNLILFAAPSE